MELGAAAQGAGEKLRLHAVGIGYEDGDGGGSDGASETHQGESSEWRGIQERFDLRGESAGTQGNRSHYSAAAFKSGKRLAALWKNRVESEWDEKIAGSLTNVRRSGAVWLRGVESDLACIV